MLKLPLLGAIGLAMAWTCTPALAGSDDTAMQRANRMAYDAAMKCFVANGHAAGLRRRAGDETKANYYDAKGKEAFDTAVGAGNALGYAGRQVTSDFGLAQAHELPPMVTDKTYFLKAVAECKALGLM